MAFRTQTCEGCPGSIYGKTPKVGLSGDRRALCHACRRSVEFQYLMGRWPRCHRKMISFSAR